MPKKAPCLEAGFLAVANKDPFSPPEGGEMQCSGVRSRNIVNIRLAKKSVWAFPWQHTKNPNELSGQSNPFVSQSVH